MRIIIIVITLLVFSSSLFSQTPSDIYQRAIENYRTGNFEEAVKDFEEYVRVKPDPVAYYLLGYSYYKLKRFSEADKNFNEAYLIDPELVPPKLAEKKEKSPGTDNE